MRTFFILAHVAVAAAQSSFATRVARQVTNAEGGRLEQTAAALDIPTPKPLYGITDVDSDITTWAWLWGWHGCSKSQKSAILNGLSEAHTVLGADGVYNIKNHWNDFATVEYLGPPWYLKSNKAEDGVRQRFDRAYKYQQSWLSWYDTQVYCTNDLEDVCTREPSSIVVNNGDKKHYLALHFCSRWFKLGTLRGIYDIAQSGNGRHDLSNYDNRARAWITAMMKIDWIGGGMKPPTVTYPTGRQDFVESSAQAKWITKSFGVRQVDWDGPQKNPSNYAWYALAQWVQQKSGDYPQKPYVPEAVEKL
ncbi:hypothetical protein Q7P37_008558 [Cladosporium fusiforme]